MQKTLEIARKLNSIETIFVDKQKNEKKSVNQYFEYLLVLDFEATCWSRQTKYIQPEIIEFPAVLYEIKTLKIVSEFQQYVMPTENHKLSDFCIELTGITQDKVDNGVPLRTCLMLFSNWLSEIENKFGIVLFGQKEGNCAFVSWSDWDLGTCLLKECKRKRIKRAEYFRNWIDLRHIYRKFYKKMPKGLKGSLNDVGLKFEGREHCGLHDARNTAYLAGQMIQDGALLRITKQLQN